MPPEVDTHTGVVLSVLDLPSLVRQGLDLGISGGFCRSSERRKGRLSAEERAANVLDDMRSSVD
jgi:hypothetical protein